MCQCRLFQTLAFVLLELDSQSPACNFDPDQLKSFTIPQVISAILAITYYAAKPAASEGEVEKSEYSSLDQVLMSDCLVLY